MIAYIAFDLGVDASMVTNSIAPKFHLRKPPERTEIDDEQRQNMESARQPLAVLDIQPDNDEGWNV
jgi:hypothetical protein